MKYKLLILTILSSVAFFNYHGMISDQVSKLLFYLNVVLCLVYAVRDGMPLRQVQYPRVAYLMVLLGICGSVLMGSFFQQQSLMVSAMTTLPYIVAYCTFWILLKMDLDRTKIMRIYIVLCSISTLVYFCNVLTVPNNMFGVPLDYFDESRGVVRLPVVFIEFFPMLVFYGINRLSDTHDRRWWLLIAVASVMIFLSVIRQIIVLTAVLGLWFFFRRVSVWKKVALIICAAVVVVYVMPQIPMYKTMVELSEDQRDDNQQTENIRITAWRYYTYDHQTNALTPIFGNGVPSLGNSVWGMMFDAETQTLGVFGADVGWAGFFWHFGAIATLGLLILLLKALLKKKTPDCQYLNYWLIFLIITSVASGPLLYYWQILDITVCLAMVFTPLTETNPTTTDVKDSTDNINIQQFPRYPQLH